ncbi:MAG: N-acetyltransferase [Ruminococcus sp.]|nr:N-acetyltransferase [Ruminococcus sp.]
MNYKIYYTKISLIDENEKEVAKIIFPEISPNVYDIQKTFVDDRLRGQGIAGKLVQMAISEINKRGGEITASCSYAKQWIEKHEIRPFTICHMVTSIDDKVTGDFLNSAKALEVSETYYEINRQLKGDAFACGRVTMESSFTGGFKPDLSEFTGANIPYEDFIAQKHSYYAVSFDRHGTVSWTDSILHDEDPGYDDCHIIEVLCENTPKKVLAYYRSIGVSYIFAGKDDIDLNVALNKLYSIFAIKKLLLEGGSIINGAFERENLIDELSLVVAPIVADKNDKPLFSDALMTDFRMLDCKKMAGGAVWLWFAK